MKLNQPNRNVSGYHNRQVKLRGFTLIELLVVIAVIAVLVSMLLPALQGARTQAKMVVCSIQQKQLGIVWISYANDYNEFFPPITSWGQIWPFLHDELDRRDVADGKVFYCSDFEPGTNSKTGKPNDWHNKNANKLYSVGYNLFTTVVWCGNNYAGGPDHPDNAPWRASDGMGGWNKYLSWIYHFRYSSKELEHIIPPWKVTERSHMVNIWYGPEKKIVIPEETPMAFDAAVADSDSIPLTFLDIADDFFTFTKYSTRHFNSAKGIPLGINAVYMDGHVEKRSGEDARILRYDSGPWYLSYWF